MTVRNLLLAASLLAPGLAGAADVVLEDQLDAAPTAPVLFVPFEVPPGTAELRVARDDLSEANILDWGLMGPDGFRGWSGGNRADVVVNAEAATPGYLPGPMAGTWQLMIGFAKVAETPVRWHVEVTFADTATLPPDRDLHPYVERGAIRPGPAWFSGDFHVHSEHSGDARPTLDAVADEATARGLDFVELSEHNTVSHLDHLASLQDRHPELLIVPGVEWTTYRGHANAIGATRFVPFWVGTDGLTADQAAGAVREQGAIFSPNHPSLDIASLCIGCAWKQEVDVVELGGIEVQTGSIDVVPQVLLDGSLALWDSWCDQGIHVAAIGGSDDHEGGKGSGTFYSPLGTPRTYVFADELSVPAILQGIRDNRTVVKLGGPDDPWAELQLLPAHGDPATREVAIAVRGGRGGQLQIVHDGEVAQVLDVDADDWSTTYRVEVPERGETRVRAHVLRDGVPRTITSHVWIDRPPEDTGTGGRATDVPADCGCAVPSTTGGWSAAVVALVGLALRRRR
jgi:MYXO-CTERM domain-containing protein